MLAEEVESIVSVVVVTRSTVTSSTLEPVDRVLSSFPSSLSVIFFSLSCLRAHNRHSLPRRTSV